MPDNLVLNYRLLLIVPFFLCIRGLSPTLSKAFRGQIEEKTPTFLPDFDIEIYMTFLASIELKMKLFVVLSSNHPTPRPNYYSKDSFFSQILL